MGTKTSLLVAAIFIGLFAGAASAQDVVEAKIPFTFVVRGAEFPAGRYRFTTSQSVLAIRGQDNDASMFVITSPAAGADPNGDDPVLVFDRYEKTYALREIWNSEMRGSSLPTRRHRESAQPVASGTNRILITPNGNETK